MRRFRQPVWISISGRQPARAGDREGLPAPAYVPLDQHHPARRARLGCVCPVGGTATRRATSRPSVMCIIAGSDVGYVSSFPRKFQNRGRKGYRRIRAGDVSVLCSAEPLRGFRAPWNLSFGS